MEINLRGTALPCVAQEDIYNGRAVKLVPAAGKSTPDVVQGAEYPDADDDTEARFVAAFRVYNETPPIYGSLPTLDEDANTTSQPYVLRQFEEGDENLPASVTLRMVAPRQKDTKQTITSGSLMLAYDDGIYTVPSGCFESGSYAVGDPVSVRADGIWYNGSGGRVATVWEYDSADQELTIKTGWQ